MNKGILIYIGGFDLPDKNAAAHRVLANGKIFRELGYEVIFIGVDNSRTYGTEFHKKSFFGFECWSVPYPKGTVSWIKYILGLSSILDFLQGKKASKVVGVICYNYPAIAQMRIKRECSRSNIKMISDATEWYDASAGSYIYRIIKNLDTTLRMNWVHKDVDGIITTSRYLTDFYSNSGKALLELPTLFDSSKFDLPPVRGRSSTKSFIYVGSPFDVGRVNRRRTNLKERLDVCIELFFQVFNSSQNFVFNIYGISESDYLDVFPEHGPILKDMAACVFFHGRQPNSLILTHIARSDFSIFFRDDTRVTLAGFPSKLAESISCGTPVITNKMKSILRYAGCEEIILCSRGEELASVKKIMHLSPHEINLMKKRAYASNIFDYKKYSLDTRDFFSKLGI